MLRTLLILTLSIASCGSGVRQEQKLDSRATPSPLLAVDYSWKSAMFREINERVRVAGIKGLEDARLSGSDLEVRIWHGFGLILIEGLVIKRVEGKWSALHLAGVSSTPPKHNRQTITGVPKSGWEICWQRLTNAGMLSLPDATRLGKEPVDPDVLSYVVELNIGGDYRTYHYTYPEANEHNEAKRMIEIGDIISEEFGLPQFRTQR